MKILAFDAGTKRIGVAVSDETATIAVPVGYIANDGTLDDEISKLISENNPEKIVVGKPLSMSGKENTMTGFADMLHEKLKSLAGEREVVMWDERLTSVQAEKAMIKGGVRRKKRKQLVDKVAAAIILQSYLDYLKMREKNG